MAPKGALASMGPDAEVEIPSATENEVDFSKISIPEAFKLLNATHHGPTESEAKSRLEEFGPNKLPETTINPIFRFLGYLWNPLSWAMEVAALLAIILLDYADFALIVALLLLNATISFVEESNADKAIKALAGALAPKCKVLRDKQVKNMDAIEIVPGDILLVRLGDIVPADIKILGETAEDEEEAPMQIDQAALTGESLPAKKFTGDTAFSGSTVKQGERHALVYATGVNTFFGRAAALIGQTNNVANIQKVMSKIGALCLITIGIWVIIELGVQFGAYSHSCYTGSGRCPTVTNILVIIVGGIPIAMPTVLSVTLALGAYQLAKHGAIVARMSAVEEMAGMDILCSDKTGTLTLNKLSIDLSASYPMGGADVNTLVKYGALSADIGSEEAVDVVLHNTYPDPDGLWKGYKRLKFVPFNPNDKFTMAVIEDEKTGQVMRLMKGAPQVVLKRAWNFDEIHGPVEQKIIDYANRGYRALGFGIASGPGAADAPGTRWEFLGLLPLFDPPRHDTAETIERCLEKGIRVKMVTGDQQLIGKETARQLGMGTNIHKIEVLLNARNGGGLVDGYANVDELVEGADGFAEVFPEHKFEIVKILQERNHMVGTTGDGVNDAPALKKADVGIAVHGATEAARGAADIVLTQPGLSVIVEAVIGARKIFQRMTTYAKYTVAMTFRISFTFGILTIAYNWYFPTIFLERNHMVGMTGDGVNDAPALKKADVGIAVHGATEAARGAADIVLTQPGLSVIVEAVIGARKIFQRMTTYAKYTVAMTFRISFTFGILTIAYNWYFPTILIVLLAVFNDGAMIALSKDRVQPSPMPNSWRLRDIFIIGIVYGLYLTISTWVLYHVASHGLFFQRDVHMFSLNITPSELVPFCTQLLAQRGITNVNAPMSSFAAQLGQQYASVTDTALNQCMVEQRYVRGAQLRALIYNQVSISGQALVFVVRTARHSFFDKAGGMTYLAFFGAQLASTLIAAFGFNGYDAPADGLTDCQLCVDSTFNYPQFWPSRTVPMAKTESVYTASVIGCTYWIVVAWIWTLIWYLALDPIKWMLMWLLNEDGWRDKHGIRKHLTRRRRHPSKTGEEHYVQVGAAAANHLNPMGRASLQKVDPHTLSRASVIKVETGPQGLRRVSTGPYRMSLETQQNFANLAPGPTLANPNPMRRISLTGRSSFSGEGGLSRRGSLESAGSHPCRRGSAEGIGRRGSAERAGLQVPPAAQGGSFQNGVPQNPADRV